MKLKHVLLIDDNPSIQVSSPERDDTMTASLFSSLNCDLVHRPLRETMLEKGNTIYCKNSQFAARYKLTLL